MAFQPAASRWGEAAAGRAMAIEQGKGLGQLCRVWRRYPVAVACDHPYSHPFAMKLGDDGSGCVDGKRRHHLLTGRQVDEDLQGVDIGGCPFRLLGMYGPAPGRQPVERARFDGALIAEGVVVDVGTRRILEQIGDGRDPGVGMGLEGGGGHLEVIHHHHGVYQTVEKMFAKMAGCKAAANAQRLALDGGGESQASGHRYNLLKTKDAFDHLTEGGASYDFLAPSCICHTRVAKGMSRAL